MKNETLCKILFAACLLFLLFARIGLAQNVTTNWAFSWPASTNMPILSTYAPGTNQAFNLYGTTNLASLITGWPRQAYWTNWDLVTNGGVIWFSNSVTVPPGVWYFALTATNLQGESFFSPVALTGPMPEAPTSLTIQAK